MTYDLTTFILEFKTPFSIAHGTRTGTDIVILKIASDNIVAWGEASLPPYLTETPQSVNTFINSFLNSEKSLLSDLPSALHNLHKHDSGNYAAKACVDIALHNWYAQKEGLAVYKLLGLKNSPLPYCSFTIGMGDDEMLRKKVEEAEPFKIIKVKLGGDDDYKIIESIRKYSAKPLCVDVNQGWKSKEFALEMIEWLSDKNVLFVEQPLSKFNIHDQQWLYEKSPLPLYADESVQVPDDIVKVKDSFDGINIKLMKCGGLSEAMKMIELARSYNLKVMIGSMSETGCAINAAAQLSSMADYTDLDGPLLTLNNPFKIVNYVDGKIIPV